MNAKYDALFSPFYIGKCEIKNRVVIPAMEGTNIVENMDGPKYNPKSHDYYIERAKNDVGLFIPGMIPIYSMMKGKWLHKSPEVFQQARPVIDEIHQNGAKIFFQLGAGFAGRNYTLPSQMLKIAGNKVLKTLTNPVLRLNDMMVAPDDGLPMAWAPQFQTRALKEKEIQNYIEGYAKSAKLCKDIGVDGVEVHAVHEGYLMDQFTTEYTNHRTDKYGGTFENRYRFAAEVVKAIKKECGDDYPVMLRYSVTSKVIDFKIGAVPGEKFREIGRTLEESEKAARYLQDAGYDALNADNGTYDSWYWAHPPVYMPLNCNLSEAEHIKQFVDIPVICAGRMQPDTAAASIREGKIDAVAIGRQFICDGEYLTKLKENREEDIRPCISCHNACLPIGYFKNSGASMNLEDLKTQGHCALNPVSFEEEKYRIRQASVKKKIAIVGGGIGGMETARLCALMGHEVELYEKTDRLGGVFIAAAAPSFKEKDKELIEWYRTQIRKLPIDVHLNTEIFDVKALDADEIVIATGSKPRKLKIQGAEYAIDATEYLLCNESVGEHVAIIGGGLTGCEIAYDLAMKGKKPFIVEMTDDLIKAVGVCAANSSCLRDYIRYYNVPVYLESGLEQVNEHSVMINTPDGKQEIPCDSVILSVGYVSNALPFEEDEHIHLLGDAAKVGNLKTVIWGAYDLAFSLC